MYSPVSGCTAESHKALASQTSSSVVDAGALPLQYDSTSVCACASCLSVAKMYHGRQSAAKCCSRPRYVLWSVLGEAKSLRRRSCSCMDRQEVAISTYLSRPALGVRPASAPAKKSANEWWCGTRRPGARPRAITRTRTRRRLPSSGTVENTQERLSADQRNTRLSVSLIYLVEAEEAPTPSLLDANAEWNERRIWKTCHESAINQGVHVPICHSRRGRRPVDTHARRAVHITLSFLRVEDEPTSSRW